jgi:hypothetical protein
MNRYLLPLLLLTLVACQSSNPKNEANTPADSLARGTFGYDVAFLQKHRNALVLRSPDGDSAQVVVVPEFQGRVMTSTAGGASGTSYGWLNYEQIASTAYQPHMHAFGGEDRLWLAPEGGQFSIFFPAGKPFTFENWQTPGLIDTAAYEIGTVSGSSVVFGKRATLENYSGTRFEFDIQRRVRVLPRAEMERYLDQALPAGVSVVAYETFNELKNIGPDWQRDRGLLAIWILGMFNAGPETVIIAPTNGTDGLTDDYFNQPGTDRLQRTAQAVLLKADAKFRTKIGLTPAASRGVAGSYDAVKRVLTLIQFDVDPRDDYLKSTWQRHADPYGGDAFNAYNDGPVEGKQMGNFYELESTSPAKALKTGESLRHRHRTYHFEGDEAALDALARRVLGVSLQSSVGSR